MHFQYQIFIFLKAILLLFFEFFKSLSFLCQKINYFLSNFQFTYNLLQFYISFLFLKILSSHQIFFALFSILQIQDRHMDFLFSKFNNQIYNHLKFKMNFFFFNHFYFFSILKYRCHYLNQFFASLILNVKKNLLKYILQLKNFYFLLKFQKPYFFNHHYLFKINFRINHLIISKLNPHFSFFYLEIIKYD
jgi:hypothetical protein